MNLLDLLLLLHLLLFYSGLLQYVIMSLFVCNYVSYLCFHILHEQTQSEKLKLLVCCEDGAMLEVIAPQKDLYDTSKTYLLEPLKFICRHFSSVKDKIKVIM